MGIDILRGLLVLAVMAYHFTIRWAPPDYPLNLFHFGGTYGRGWSLGAFGVHVFFVISGYVITLSVLRSRSAPRFAMGRFLRIYPPYVLAVLLSFAVPWLLGPVSLRSSLADLGGTLLMLPRELQLRYTDGAFWTLTVEAKFYFFVFLGYLGLRERFWLVLVALGWIGPLVLLVAPGAGDKLLIAPYVGLFLFGMTAWYLFNQRDLIAALALGSAGAFAYAMAARGIRVDGQVSAAAHALILAGVIGVFVLARFNPSVHIPGLTLLGDISYEVYLVHQVLGVAVIGAVKQATGCPDLAAMMAGTVTAIAVAYALNRWLAPPLRAAARGAMARLAMLSPRPAKVIAAG